MSLKDEIPKIVQLQEIDSRIYNFAQEKNIKIPQSLEQIKDESEQIKQTLSFFEDKIKNIQLAKKNKELDLAAKEENMKKNQAQLYQLKTNKEYKAKLSEIGSLKADISTTEDDLLTILDEIDSVESDFQKQKKEIDGKEREIKNKEAQLRNAIKDIEAQMHNLEAKRQRFCGQIDKKVLAKYEQLLQCRKGLALVPVSNSNCGACHLALTHQKINEIKMFNNLVFCENCVRILYIPDDIC
ncbi:MAG: C4-type zinc ribbon domain-containing protein [Omnitrophica bacterium]|nr:C4-type zinc ribbon domain-containing protein [Candidatus Omnitrophota bacterium]